MSKLGELFSDDYNFETLVVPAMVIAIPIMVVLGLFGVNVSWLVGFAVLGIELVLFPLWLMASWIRDTGKALELKLFPNGLPTHTALRLTNGSDYDARTRRQRLEAVTGVALATLQEEQADSDDADARIRDAMAVAREKMRSTADFKLLRRELKSYGFWRNMAASRRLGIWTTSACALLAVAALFVMSAVKLPLAALVCSTVMLSYWLFAVGNGKVSSAAERYKKQFFNSLTTL